MSRRWSFVVAGLGVAVLLAVLVSPFASPSPDGLQRVAEDSGFADRATAGHDGLAYGSITGFLGLLVTFVLVIVLLRVGGRVRSRP